MSPCLDDLRPGTRRAAIVWGAASPAHPGGLAPGCPRFVRRHGQPSADREGCGA